jgi:hypothetical protein
MSISRSVPVVVGRDNQLIWLGQEGVSSRKPDRRPAMSTLFGPWATAIHVGSRPQLTAFLAEANGSAGIGQPERDAYLSVN